MARLSKQLLSIAAAGNKSLVTYIVAGDPGISETVPLMHQLVASGTNVIELGVPFSDPEAEGPVIQRAHERALVHNTSLQDCLAMVAEFRQQDTTTPIVLMGYLNPIESMGYAKFAAAAQQAGVDGTIIVNLPPEESGELSPILTEKGIEPVFLLAPTTTDQRAAYICSVSKGFVYYVSLKGTTGAATLDVVDVAEKLRRFKQQSSLPIMVGFGVKDAASAKAVSAVADGVVVGSAIVDLMEKFKGAELREKVALLVAELRVAID